MEVSQGGGYNSGAAETRFNGWEKGYVSEAVGIGFHSWARGCDSGLKGQGLIFELGGASRGLCGDRIYLDPGDGVVDVGRSWRDRRCVADAGHFLDNLVEIQ